MKSRSSIASWRYSRYSSRLTGAGALFLAAALALLPSCAPSGGELPESSAAQGSEVVVAIEYTMNFSDGREIATNVGQDPLVFALGHDEVFPALEEAVKGLVVGDTAELSLTPEQAYGERDPDAVREVAVDLLPEDARVVGARMLAEDHGGSALEVRVAAIYDDVAVIDMNHPLAGESVDMRIRILRIGPPDPPQ